MAADPKKRLRFARECVELIADYGFDGIVSRYGESICCVYSELTYLLIEYALPFIRTLIGSIVSKSFFLVAETLLFCMF